MLTWFTLASGLYCATKSGINTGRHILCLVPIQEDTDVRQLHDDAPEISIISSCSTDGVVMPLQFLALHIKSCDVEDVGNTRIIHYSFSVKFGWLVGFKCLFKKREVLISIPNPNLLLKISFACYLKEQWWSWNCQHSAQRLYNNQLFQGSIHHSYNELFFKTHHFSLSFKM